MGTARDDSRKRIVRPAQRARRTDGLYPIRRFTVGDDRAAIPAFEATTPDQLNGGGCSSSVPQTGAERDVHRFGIRPWG